MATFELEKDGKTFEVEAPNQAAALSALPQIESGATAKAKTSPGIWERLGTGLMDPIYGAAQIGARIQDEGFSADPEASEQQRQERIKSVDTTVKDREKSIESARPESARGTTDWVRAAGSIPSTLALTSPLSVFGGIPGAVIGGAGGAVIQPTTDTENFGSEKLKSGAFGAVAGGVLGAAGKGIAAAYQTVRNPGSKAIAELGRAAERDGTTLEQLQQRLSEIRNVRPGATIADVAGENVRGLVERIGQTPGAGVAKLAPRITANQQQQLERISGDVAGLTGTTRSAFQAIEETMAERLRAATPLYRTALDEGDKVIWSPELERITASPAVQSAMRSAVTTWKDNAVADGFGAMRPGAMVSGGNLQFLNSKVPVFPNLQFWDYTKRVLDNMTSAAIRAGKDQEARTLTRLTQILRNELDNPAHEIPTYNSARAAWGGPSQYLDAIEEGRSILSRNVSSEEMAARFGQMSEANQEGYRIGAASAIRAAMGNDPAKLADFTKYVRSPTMREKIVAMMPSPEAADRWLASLDYEVKSSELTGLALKGSPTARRLAQQSDADSIGGDLIVSALSGEMASMGFLKKVLGALPKKAVDTLRSRSDNILIDLLTTPEGAAAAPANLEIPRVSNTAIEAGVRHLATGAGSALAQPTQ